MLLKKESKKTVVAENMQQEIINAAGMIYNYLTEKCEVSMSKMKKDLDLAGNFAEMGLGWLSREDKIQYNQKARSISVSLR